MLAADAHLEVGPRLAAPRHRGRDELAEALDVEHLERVVLQDAALVVERQELVLRILAGERERRLGQVVGAEREELGDLGQLPGAHAGAHDLDHGAELKCHRDPVFLFDLAPDVVHIGAHAA